MSLDPNKTYLQWNGTTFPNSSDAQFKAPAGSSIDWGDGTIETFNTASTTVNTHTYTDGKSNHTITISGLRNIGSSAFKSCSSLTGVIISDSVKYIANFVFSNCTSLINVDIGGGVKNIGYEAFYGCSGLTNFIIPDGVTKVGGAAFINCINLKIIILFPETPPKLEANDTIPTISTIYVPQKSKEAYKAAQYWSSFADKIQSNNTYLSLIRYNKKNKEYINGKINLLKEDLETSTADLLSTKLDKTGGTITGSLVISDGLIVQGTTTSVDTQNLKVKDKLIYVAKDNTTALTTPAGLITPYYDGENSGGIIYDNTGTAYVGDVVLNSDGNVDLSNSSVWPLCARDKSNNWVNGHVPVWDSTNEKLVDSGNLISTSADGGSIAKRNSDGTLLVGTTTRTGDTTAAINREYLEANASLLRGGIEIADYTNLNTLTTPGNYYCKYNDGAAKLVNCPVSQAFTMKVYYSTGISNYYLRQEIKQYYGPNYYIRSSENSGSTWSPWVRYTTSNEVVLKTTDQSISGIKTFSDGIKSNKTPTADNDVVRLSDLNNAISQAITTALNTQV